LSERVWDPFLSERDRARAAAQPALRKGGGQRPALLLVDLYREVFGDRPQPLLEALTDWPNSCGLNGWESLPHIRALLDEARRLSVPVIHATGLDGVPGWRDPRPAIQRTGAEAQERARRRYEIVDELRPAENEIVLRKTAPSAFWGTPLAGLLNGLRVDTVIVAGESTSGCVRATVVDAKSYRLKVLVPEQCVFDRDDACHAINLFDMNEKYADVIPLAEVLDYLASSANGQAGGRSSAAGGAPVERQAVESNRVPVKAS
jgi:maleamate amidohydrolase